MVNKKVPVLSIVLYVFAGLLVIYSVWSIVESYKYLASYSFQGNEYGFVNYYMTNAGLFVLFAAVLATLGWLLQKFSPLVIKDNLKAVDQENDMQYETVAVDADQPEETAEVISAAEDNTNQDAE